MRTIHRSLMKHFSPAALLTFSAMIFIHGSVAAASTMASPAEKAAAALDGYDLSIAEDFFGTWVYPKFSSLSAISVRSPYDSSTPPAEVTSCRQSYQRITDSRRLKIRIALGYFDVSDGSTLEASGINYGQNVAEDIFAYHTLKWTLKYPCPNGLAACGFTQNPLNPDLLEKIVRFPDGRDVNVSVEIRRSSLTPFHHVNTQSRAKEQQALTASTNDFFFGGVHAADVLLYLGHARNGGGPDFGPPPLTRDRHVDYAYYKKQRPGFSRLLAELKTPGPQPLMIGLLNCMTEHHFGKMLRQVTEAVGSQTGFILTNGFDGSKRSHLTDYDDGMKGALATVDGLMKMQCLSGFQESLDTVMAYEPKMVIRQFLGAKKTAK